MIAAALVLAVSLGGGPVLGPPPPPRPFTVEHPYCNVSIAVLPSSPSSSTHWTVRYIGELQHGHFLPLAGPPLVDASLDQAAGDAPRRPVLVNLLPQKDFGVDVEGVYRNGEFVGRFLVRGIGPRCTRAEAGTLV